MSGFGPKQPSEKRNRFRYWGAKRTCPFALHMSAYDPKRHRDEGHYKPNGQFEFRDSSVVVGFNVAANAVKAAAKRMAELDVEGKPLTKSQQKGWERFRSTK
jgi:hypothetical protein